MTRQERVTWVVYRTAWLLCSKLPERFVKRFFILIADVTAARKTDGFLRLQFNLARALNLEVESSEARSVAKAAMRSYMLYYADLFRLNNYSAEDLHHRVRFEHREFLDNAIAEGNGVVVAITHSGNWDLCGAYVATQFKDVTSVAERLKPEELFDAFVAVRSRYGLTVLPHKGGTRPPSEILEEKLRAGHVIALAGDRDFTRNGISAEFFGHSAKFPAGAIRLAQKTGAKLLFAAIWTDKQTSVITMHQPIPVEKRPEESIAHDLIKQFETAISAHPENWHMLQQIWPDHPTAWGGRPR